ncbi:MAG: purine-binding chemotaxis protein CheW [Gammaproteobacteria bacterium]|nr:purine-binding chemotaxis protein CheW [Gammaproteobacteria bacterium]
MFDDFTHDLNTFADHAENQFLTFMLGSEEFGIDILQIQEIKGWGSVTKIPNMPDYILGVINLRGTIVPIMDLRKRFKLQNAEYNATTVIIVCKAKDENHERTVGMVVDAVSEVYDMNEKSMQATPDFGSNIDADFIKGLANIDDKMIILMNVDKLISHEVKDHLEEVKKLSDELESEN